MLLTSRILQLGTALGVATTTVVFNRVNLHRYGQDGIVGYKAAQWTSFSFGVLGTSLHCRHYLNTEISPNPRDSSVAPVF